MKRVFVLFLSIAVVISISLPAYAKVKIYPRFRIEDGSRIKPGISSNTIRLDDGSFRMYYTDGDIKVADSTKGKVFSNKRVVLTLSQVKAVFPRIKQISNSAIFQLRDNRWRMIFEGKSGTSETAPRRLYSAVSVDGVTNFTVESGVRLQDRGSNGHIFTSVPEVVKLNRNHRIYYSVGLWTRSAVSSNEGRTWRKEGDIKLNRRRVETLVDADVTRVGRKYVLLFATLPVTRGEVGTQRKTRLQKIYRAFSRKGRLFKFAGLKLALPSAHAIDPDMVRRGPRKRGRIYFSRMKRGAQTSDILSALYR
ncbi:MAG TPA: hypothetical protein ENI11_02210 [Actinobacteria bacterium]|nr:hypothetical protein [Actinomycetota bacterium]